VLKITKSLQRLARQAATTAFALLFAGHSAIAICADIPGWRGDGSGRFPTANPPTTWSPTSNVIWKTRLPAYSASSPILIGQRLFLCAETNTLICVDAAKGTILWQRAANGYDDALPSALAAKAREDEAASINPRAKRDLLQKESSAVGTQLLAVKKEAQALQTQLNALPGDTQLQQIIAEKNKQIARINNDLKDKKAAIDKIHQELDDSWAMPRVFFKTGYSWPTPVSDGKLVYALFGTGVAVCYDLDGNRKWIRLVERPVPGYGLRSSPVLCGDQLLVDVRNVSALNAATGETNWSADLIPGDLVLATIGGQSVVVTAHGEMARVRDGKVLAKHKLARPWPKGDSVVTPVLQDGVVYLTEAATVVAVKLPAQAPETTIDAKDLWLWQRDVKQGGEFFKGSPVVDHGLVYEFPGLGNVLTVLNATTGEIVYEKEIQAKLNGCYPSLTLAGTYMFAGGESGTMVVFEVGREYKPVSVNTLEAFRATPIFSGKRMYLRGLQNLYCIGE